MPVRGKTRPSRGKKTTLDFSNVETRVKVEEGEYEVAVEECEEKEGQAAPYLAWKFKIDEGSESDGGVLYLNTSMSEAALWNLKALFEALGIEVDGEMEVDPSEYIGERCMVSVELKTFEGKKRPHIVDFWAVPKKDKKATTKGKAKPKDEEEEDEPEEKPARGKSKPAGKADKSKGKPEPEEKENLTQDQITDMDEDELEDIVKEYDLEVDLSKFKTLRKKQTAVVDAAEKADVLESE